MSVLMYDSITAGALPARARAVAGYIDGSWPSFPAIVERFYPRAHCLSITVFGGVAACLDIENGDATPDHAGPWVKQMLRHGVWRPCLYANASTMPAVRANLAAHGIPRHAYRLWIAAYPGTGGNVPEGYDAHQYTDHGPNGENYDISICNDDFFPTPPPKPKPRPTVKLHPKVIGASGGAAVAGAIIAALKAAGVHVTAGEISTIQTLAAMLAGWLVPSARRTP